MKLYYKQRLHDGDTKAYIKSIINITIYYTFIIINNCSVVSYNRFILISIRLFYLFKNYEQIKRTDLKLKFRLFLLLEYIISD